MTKPRMRQWFLVLGIGVLSRIAGCPLMLNQDQADQQLVSPNLLVQQVQSFFWDLARQGLAAALF